MTFFFENAKDRITLTTRDLRNIFGGTKSSFQDLAFNISAHVSSSGWDKTICAIKDQDETIALHDNPTKVTLYMLADARKARQSRLDIVQNGDDPNAIKAQQLLVSASAELYKFLTESVCRNAHKILRRYA